MAEKLKIYQRHRQKGVVTTFTGVMVLVLLTLMMFFAMRVGILDQRVSANENRQKQAFHAAESGIQHAKEYFNRNVIRAASPKFSLLGDGSDGWLAEGRWARCSEANLSDTTHPCLAEPDNALHADLYYWNWADTDTGNPADPTLLPLGTDTLLPAADDGVEVQALLCLLVINPDLPTPVQGCSTNTDPANKGAADYVNGTRYVITLISKGEVDCDANGDNCAKAVIRELVSNFGAVAGGQSPAVPLTTKNMFPPSGAAEIVANPNGGGVGVPTSVWMNRNPSCTPDGSAIDPSQGSWATCEAHEWYTTESIPDDVQCPGSCSCSFQEALSYTHGSDDILGIDLIEDDEFPCDLFQFYFGTPRDNYAYIKSFAQILEDCDSLGPWSSGIYWISGPSCSVNANVTIGSTDAPVLLISAAGVTRMAGGATIFGTLYVSDVELAGATFESQGNNIVYGQVILDAQFGSYNGTFQIVYNENLLELVGGNGGLGNIIGGWSDFHDDDWQYQ